MAGSRVKAYAVIFGILSGAIAFLALTGEVPVEVESSLRMELPDTIGGYTGVDMLYCQNDQCALSFPETEVDDTALCAECGGILAPVSVAEQNLLSPGTEVVRKRYTNPDGNVMTVSIVLSSHYRRSIHRPQQCVEAQGYTITDRRVLRVPVGMDGTLSATFLGVGSRQASAAYAYWFTANERETPDYVGYLFWSAWDAAVHNTRRRWAYVSVAVDGVQSSEREITDFIAGLHRAISEQDQAQP